VTTTITTKEEAAKPPQLLKHPKKFMSLAARGGKK